MVIVRLMGGMGNQMFQYAMARTLAYKHGTQLFIDNSLCPETERNNSSGLTLRPYGLDVFNVQGQILTGEKFFKTIKIRKENKLRRIAAIKLCQIVNMFFSSWRVCITERKDVSYDYSLLSLPDDIILQGYFPSYKYFIETEDIIRQDFIFKPEPDKENKTVISSISACNSVSVHFRLGDYVSNDKTNDKFGICNMSYYKNAIEYINKKVKEPRFFIFTNDPEYVKSNLKINYPSVYITHNSGCKNYEDMRLMSLCKHNIIANSSFSWWAAWLNENPDKIVISPSPAFNEEVLTDMDYYPDDWILLPKC